MAKVDYSVPVTTLAGESTDLTPFEGKVLLVVNTASKCGFTPQYAGLEDLWRRYGEDGLVVLGFPCNQFGSQEPGQAGDIEEFCQVNYGVSFPMFDKVEVNGAEEHPLFSTLKSAAPGLLGSRGIKWNFTKFLVAADGTVLDRYAPSTAPGKLAGDIEKALGK